jgi:hypothetical protein
LASSADNRLTRYNGTNGIQGSGIVVSDTDAVSAMASLTLSSAGVLQAGSSPSGTSALEYNGYFYATKVYGAVWG